MLYAMMVTGMASAVLAAVIMVFGLKVERVAVLAPGVFFSSFLAMTGFGYAFSDAFNETLVLTATAVAVFITFVLVVLRLIFGPLDRSTTGQKISSQGVMR